MVTAHDSRTTRHVLCLEQWTETCQEMSRGRVLHLHWSDIHQSSMVQLHCFTAAVVLYILVLVALFIPKTKERGAFCNMPDAFAKNPRDCWDCLAFSEEQKSRKLPLDWLHDPSYCSASLWFGPHGAGRRGSTEPSKLGRRHVETCRIMLKHAEMI